MNYCKIIVKKRTYNKEIVKQYYNETYQQEPFELCELFEEGQEFIVKDPNIMPEGFCAWAWVDIHRELVTLMMDGNLDWMKNRGTAITCCTDGFRPVIFLLKRIEKKEIK